MFNWRLKISNKLIKSSLIYLIFSLLIQIVNLFYIPLLIKHFDQETYGIYNLLIPIESIFSILFLLGIPSGYTRFYNEEKNKADLENTIFNMFCLIGIIMGIIIYFFNKELSLFLLKGIKFGNRYIVLLSISAYLDGLIAILTVKYSMEFKALKSSMISFIRISLNYLMVFFSVEITLEKLFIYKISISLLILLILFVCGIKKYRFKIKFKKIKAPLKFSLGLIIGQISTWILTLIDRYFLSKYYGFSDVALYSFAYKIGMLINPIFIFPFTKVYTPLKFKVYSLENGHKIIRNCYDIYIFLGMGIALVISLYARVIVLILSNSKYLDAVFIIPIIVGSYLLWGCNEFYSLGIVIKNKSVLNSMIAFLSAVLNILLNILLIPKIGIYGAAFSTLISYILTNILYYKIGKKYYNINLSHLKSFKFICVGIGIYIISIYIKKITNFNFFIEIILNLFLICVYVFICFYFKWVSIITMKGILKYENNKKNN